MSSDKKLRREPRIDISLPVTLQMPDGPLHYEINNASYRGVFITCPDPLPLRKLVRFQTRLGVDDEPLQMLGLIAHTINAAEARESGKTPGMGLQLFSVGSQTQERWRDFITQEYEKDPEARERVAKLESPHVTVHMRSMDQLHTFAGRDLNGSIFVRTSELSPVDSAVVCDIVHPDDDGVFALQARVVDVKETPRRERGMRLEFDELDQERLDAFAEFIGEEI
jgi:hypothetical protein